MNNWAIDELDSPFFRARERYLLSHCAKCGGKIGPRQRVWLLPNGEHRCWLCGVTEPVTGRGDAQ